MVSVIRSVACLLVALLTLSVVVPAAAPGGQRAEAMTLADGPSLSGDFTGNGRSQIASLYDPQDDLGLRIVVLERGGTTDALTHSQWFISGPNSFDLQRMKVTASDVNGDGKSDLVALYDDGGASVRVLVFLSTGSSFVYAGAWWQSHGYAWSRTATIVSGNFSAVGNQGLLLIYQYDNFQMRVHYLESDGSRYIYGGDQGVYDSGPGQYDTTRARFAIGRFTRTSGPDQIASIYQYPGFRIRTHVFDPTPAGLVPVNGWAGVYDSGEGQFDLGRMKLATADLDGDGRSDIAALYANADGSVGVWTFSGARELAPAGPPTVLPAGTLAWSRARIVGGDWDGDRRGDLATLEARDDGRSHAVVLRSTAGGLVSTRDAWVTPANEVQRIACADECWPLTGLAHHGGPVARRGLLVKIDNSPQARPHYGLSEADMVFEVLVEGWITRLAVAVHSGSPGTLGSIRSGRIADRYLTPMIRGGLVYSGATIEETEMFRNDARAGGYFDLDANIVPAPYYRTPTRVSPYNMFTSSDALRRALNDLGGGTPVTIPRWDFLRSASHGPTVGGFSGSASGVTATIPYRARATVRYDYDAASRTYARYQDDGAGRMALEVDAANGVVIGAKNVVVIYTDVWTTNIVQDSMGSLGLDMRLEGAGNATVFRNGLRQDGTWARNTIYDAFVFTSYRGERILLSPGQTWVHIVPNGWSIPSQ